MSAPWALPTPTLNTGIGGKGPSGTLYGLSGACAASISAAAAGASLGGDATGTGAGAAAGFGRLG
ncbi:MAG: hypothetical protein WA924_07740, partial [Burkholderiaceae bacterium]